MDDDEEKKSNLRLVTQELLEHFTESDRQEFLELYGIDLSESASLNEIAIELDTARKRIEGIDKIKE